MQQLTLSDGRRVGVAEFGAPRGRPVIYCHGLPASRLDGRISHEAAVRTGARVIAFDRPGYGLSDFKDARRIGDWADDVISAADALGLERFAVLGVSGGGPYALACAARLGDRVSALGLLCALGRMESTDDCVTMNPFARSSFWLARTAPDVSRLFNCGLAPFLRYHPDWTLKLLAATLPPPDQAVLADRAVYDTLAASMTEAFRQGGDGAAHDLTLFARAWDFDVGAIRVPCYLWHGEQDTTVPIAIGRRTAAMLPGCRATFYADEGHYSLPVRRMDTVLRALLEHA